jgi:hypothetical protein
MRVVAQNRLLGSAKSLISGKTSVGPQNDFKSRQYPKSGKLTKPAPDGSLLGFGGLKIGPIFPCKRLEMINLQKTVDVYQ